MPRGSVSGIPTASRSLSVSSDSDAVEEPAVLEEARQGTSAAGEPVNPRGRNRISWVLSRSSESSNSADSDNDSPRPRRCVLSSSSRGFSGADKANGGRIAFASRRPIRVSFMDEGSLPASTQYRSSADVSLSVQSKEAARRPNASQLDLKANIACRAQAVANVSRNMAAMAAEKRAIDETQNPALDAMECEVNGLHRQLNEVKESFRKRCLNILNSLVGRKWTIDTSDSLAKRMLRPSKWTAKSQVQMEAEEGQGESQQWFGPSANDVFGDCLVIAERNPYRIVGVFARRYRDTRQRLPYVDDIFCSKIFPCIQQEQQTGRPFVLKVPPELPKPIKAFPDSRSMQPASQKSPVGGGCGSPVEETTKPLVSSSRLDNAYNASEHHFRKSSLPAPSRSSWSVAQVSVGDRTDACCTTQCTTPCSRYTCVIPPGNYVQSSALENYPKATVENNNMRIPTRLADYLERNCVRVERPSWDRRFRRKKEIRHANHRRSRTSAQSDDTESSLEEDEEFEHRASGFSSCEIPSILPDSVATGLPQFLRRELGNRWLPTLFAEADVRVSEYWKLENMRNREKAVWVYQGIQTEPKPYPWEEVPLEGKPLSLQEIAQQRRDARSRRHLSPEAERLLRGVGQGSNFNCDANTAQRPAEDCTIMNFKTAQLRGRSPGGGETPAEASSTCAVAVPGTRGIRRVR